MTIGELITRWTIRAAVLLYVLAVAGELQRRVAWAACPPSRRVAWAACPPSRRVAWAACPPLLEAITRWAWTLGCGLCVAHVAAAFHFYHGWSHAAAYRDTARQTAEVSGLDWGGGLYFNYAFTLLWVADALWWWLAPSSRRARPFFLTAALEAYFAFIVFNATVVFETGAMRWFGVAAFCLLAAR
jgi:hypothetical protein